MAIARDATSQVSSSTWYNPGGSSYTWSHTCTGSNRALIVGLQTGSLGDIVTGVTYGGEAMTLVGKHQRQDTSSQFAYLFAKANPTSGANNIVVSLSSGSEPYTAGFGVSYTDVDQTTPIEAYTANSESPRASGTDYTTSVTTLTDNAWLVGIINEESGATINAITGTTFTIRSGQSHNMVDSNGAKSPAGSYSLGLNRPDPYGEYWISVIGSLKPYSAPSGPVNLKSWNGVAKADLKSINGVAIADLKSWN